MQKDRYYLLILVEHSNLTHGRKLVRSERLVIALRTYLSRFHPSIYLTLPLYEPIAVGIVLFEGAPRSFQERVSLPL